ncbi:type II toxin-antitoxin system RelE family toxin [Desulfobacula sp.]
MPVRVDELGNNLPDPNTTKMKGNNSFHKVRSGDYCIIYEIHNDKLVILVVKIGHRKKRLQKTPIILYLFMKSLPLTLEVI